MKDLFIFARGDTRLATAPFGGEARGGRGEESMYSSKCARLRATKLRRLKAGVGHIKHGLQETRAALQNLKAAQTQHWRLSRAQPTATAYSLQLRLADKAARDGITSGAHQRAQRGTASKNLAKALAVSSARGRQKRSSPESSTRH